MLGVVSRINYNYSCGNGAKNIIFKEKTGALSNINQDSFEKSPEVASKNEKKNKKSISNKTLAICALASLAIGLAIPTLLKKKDASHETFTKKISLKQPTPNHQFTNLMGDSGIPTLETCKSINKDLKLMLQNQISLLNADKEVLKKAGNPTQANSFLLSGPPGTGKTFFSKIFSKTIDAEYLEVLVSDLDSRWAGAMVENMDKLFKDIIYQAHQNPEKKLVVTFNEIDSLLAPVQHLTGGHGGDFFVELRRQRSTFLTYLDRLATETPNVIVIGTTNMAPKANSLDGATMSRFSQLIEINYPDKDCLYEAIKVGLAKIENIEKFITNNDAKIKELAKTMHNRKFSYRDLNSVLNDSKMFYLKDLLNNKKAEFKFEYLSEAQRILKTSDGEREVSEIKNRFTF